MNRLKWVLPVLLLFVCASQAFSGNNRNFDIIVSGDKSAPRVLACKAPEFSFHLPQMAGNFRLGVSDGKNSHWASELKKVSVEEGGGKLSYTLKDPLLGNGSVLVKVAGLTDSDGIVVEVETMNVPEQLQLIWSFGGCYGKVLENLSDSKMEPVYCTYNVFSVEGTAFTVYYGESMKLKVIQGVTPLESDIRLSDAHQQQTPLAFFQSGKKTDSPALAAALPVTNGQKLYFCFYTQNNKADYNYFMLPELFKREFNKRH